MIDLKKQAELLVSGAIEFISVKAENTLEENAKEDLNSTTYILIHVIF